MHCSLYLDHDSCRTCCCGWRIHLRVGNTAGGLELDHCAADSNYGDCFVPAAIPCQTRVA